MLPPQSVVLVDTMAIKIAHDLNCWNALRNKYRLHSVQKCVEEATRKDHRGKVLVNRTSDDLASELTLGAVDRLMVTKLTLDIDGRADLNDGELHLLAYALTLKNAWFLCGPDNGTVRAMQILALLDRMVSFESLAKAAGNQPKELQFHFTERWLSKHRIEGLLDNL